MLPSRAVVAQDSPSQTGHESGLRWREEGGPRPPLPPFSYRVADQRGKGVGDNVRESWQTTPDPSTFRASFALCGFGDPAFGVVQTLSLFSQVWTLQKFAQSPGLPPRACEPFFKGNRGSLPSSHAFTHRSGRLIGQTQ